MNKAILMGRLTRDPELRTTQSGVPVVQFTLAVDRRFKNQNGERQADFISCQAWRQTAEFIAKYFQKGAKLAVVGSIQTGSYEKNGQTVYTTDVVVEEAYFVESRRQQDGQHAPAPQAGRPSQSGRSADNNGARQQDNSFDSFMPGPADDTSLPFDL
ncbi:MAG: single-stranded DNA-binding protein [Oscillospiraceae bacterium]|nr:single-stranded DNA-binding protein [Oscillospiraceae bacterium]MDD4369149.1 single-stranded DNA-binding protein [Oscillospiraceae bacterium]